MTVQTQPRGQHRQTPTRIWHLCREHPNFGDPPCTTACVAFCGRAMRATSDSNGKLLTDSPRRWRKPLSEVAACVVCLGLDR